MPSGELSELWSVPLGELGGATCTLICSRDAGAAARMDLDTEGFLVFFLLGPVI